MDIVFIKKAYPVKSYHVEKEDFLISFPIDSFAISGPLNVSLG